MKSNEELNLPESLRYTDEHVWVRMDGGEAVIGISDFAQDQLGEIAFVDLPAVGVRFDAGSDFGTVPQIGQSTVYAHPRRGRRRERGTGKHAHAGERLSLWGRLDDPHPSGRIRRIPA